MSVVVDVVRDLALLVFDRAVERARERLPHVDKVVVTRDDIASAVVELRYEQVAVLVAQLDTAHRVGALEREAAERRGRENAEHVDTVIVEPDGTEVFTRPFKK